MAKKNQKMDHVQFRYYSMEPGELVLPLLGEDWIRPYGQDIDVLHFHNYMEIGICHNGKRKIQIRDQIYDFVPGCMTIIPANIPHNTISESLAFWEWMYFDITNAVEYMSKLYKGGVDQEDILNLLNHREIFFHETEYDQLRRGILAIRDECAEKGCMYREKIQALLWYFIVELYRIYDATYEPTYKKQIAMAIAPAITYVEEHYKEEIYIQDLADACSISESHFRRVFQKCMNMKPAEYINTIRVKKACEMLRKTEASMEEVAYKTGFVNVSTFNRNFKRLMEDTPYQWKRANVKKRNKDVKISAFKGW